MKKVMTFFVLILIALLVGTWGCSTDGTAPGDSPVDPAALESMDFALLGAEDAFDKIADPTLDHEMSMGAVLADGTFHPPSDRPHHHGNHLWFILRHLDVTQDQLEEIRSAVMAYRDEIRDAFVGILEVNMEIIRAANAGRMEIVEAFHNGEMTREEAEEQLRELGRRTRLAIRSNPENAPFLHQICEARRTLFDAIRAILFGDQASMWDGWRSGNDDTCSGG